MLLSLVKLRDSLKPPTKLSFPVTASKVNCPLFINLNVALVPRTFALRLFKAKALSMCDPVALLVLVFVKSIRSTDVFRFLLLVPIEPAADKVNSPACKLTNGELLIAARIDPFLLVTLILVELVTEFTVF